MSISENSFFGGSHFQSLSSLLAVSHQWLRVYRLIASGANRLFVLPFAKFIRNGGPIFYVLNIGESNNILVTDRDDVVIATITPGNAVLLCMADNSTNAGLWYIKTFTIL